jgi:hypothetical protein
MDKHNVGAMFDRIPIDVAGLLPLGDHGNRYLVMAMDYTTKQSATLSPTKRRRRWRNPW